jgi:PAS domain S-box-containing protein
MKVPDHIFTKIFPEDRAGIDLTIARSAAGMEPWQMEFRATVRGRTMWIFGRSIPEKRRPDGSILWNGVLIDITERKQAEAALRESEEKFRVLAETIPVSIIVFQGNHDVYVNDYTSRVTGRSKEELCTMNFWDGIHPDCQEMLKARGIARLNGEDVPSRYEVKYLTKSGEIRWADISVGKIIFGGTMAGLATLVDITDRKRTEDALKKRERDYRSIIENIQDAFYRTDTSGNLILISPSFAHQFGYADVHEVIGKNIRETFYFTPSERDRFLDRIRETGKVEEYRITLKRRDGVAVVVSVSSHAYYTDDGKSGGIEGVLHDITDRVNAEAALANSERSYREFLESLPHIIFEMDASSRITYANRCARETAGYAEEVIRQGIGALTLIDPLHHDRFRELLEATRETGPATSCEFTVICRNGTVFPAVIVLVPLYREENPGGFRAIVIDISERKNLERDLLESRKMFGTLAARSRDGIVIADASGRLLFANRKMAEMIGFDPGTDLAGSANIFDFIQPELRDRVRGEFSRLARESDSSLTDYRIVTRKNTRLSIECIGRKIAVDGKDAILLTLRDVASRRIPGFFL